MSGPPPSTGIPAHRCPSCDRPVDALRAGTVAIVAGRFLYFCDGSCKAKYFADLAGSSVSESVVTAEPPPVAARAPRPALPSVPEDTSPPSFPLATALNEGDEIPRSVPIRLWSAEGRDDAPAAESPSPPSRTAGDGAATAARVLAALAISSGMLSLGLALVGGGAAGARLPLAALAVACVLGRVALVPKDPSDVSRVVVLAPLVLELLAAGYARGIGAAAAGTIAAATGLAAAATAIVELVLARAREVVAAQRERVAEALDTGARGVDGKERRASEVRAGEQVVVETGETVPVDGAVVSGEAVVSPWIDASVDVTKREGDVVVAGARVLSGRLRIAATWSGADRAFARLTSSPTLRVDVAAPFVRATRRAAEIGVFVLGVLVGLATYANGAPLEVAVASACAAAFGFSAAGVLGAVTLHHARGQLRALQNGIIYKDASAFERAGLADTAVVCARGTLLLGEPEIVAIEPFGGTDSDELLAQAAGVASGSSHPFATALLHTARERSLRSLPVRTVVHQGSGATAVDANGVRLVLGRRSFLLGEKVSVAVADASVTGHEEQGRSVLLFAMGDRVLGVFAFQDGLRAGARGAVQKLHDAGIEPVLLSGEARETCEILGRSLDIEHIRPEVAHADRASEVRSLGEGGDVVAVLGQPSLDDAALGAADVSVALGAAGAVPGEWAVSLAGTDVRAAVLSLALPRMARERSRMSVALGFGPGLLFALGLSFGLLTPAAAPLAMVAGATLAILYAKD